LNAVVFGARGQLGSELVLLLPGAGHPNVAIEDEQEVETVLRSQQPDFVFNCAAYNAVDRAETEMDIARAGNTIGPLILATACARHHARLVHFSTNYVFDGRHDRPYLETDEPAPLSVYGSSKRAGEEAVLGAAPDALVIRTAALYGGPRSFPNRILERARSGEPLRVVSDQHVNPTYAKDLAAAATELAEQGLSGIVHVVSDGCCGWDDFARAALDEFGVAAAVESVTSEEYRTPAQRPRNGCLGSARFHALRPWREALAEWASTSENP
jgi:dTDP-4-dehydrorhamnose reductase